MIRSTSVSPWILGAAIAALLAGCGRSDTEYGAAPPPPPALKAEVARTTYGIPHIKADSFKGLGYGLAYAYAQNNVCMFADTLLTVRGERSRFFGPSVSATRPLNGEYGAAIDYLNLNNEDSDFFFKGYLDIEQLRAGHAAGSSDAKQLLEGYVAGYNRYLRDNVGKLPAACNNAPWVRPITIDDLYLAIAEKALHASGEVFGQEIVDGARDGLGTVMQAAPRMQQAPDTGFVKERLSRLTREQLGSNGLAIGKDLSATGRGLLLGNPHYPWTSTDRFYQAHLTVPGQYDAMGVILGGIPTIVIGFNKDVAWTHTVSTSVHFTNFRVPLDPTDASGRTYLFDGAPVKMTSKTVSVDSLQPDGGIVSRTKTFFRTRQGAVIVKHNDGLTWGGGAVHVIADANLRNTRIMDQWLAMGRAASVTELKAALDKHVGLPWVNTVAADRSGNTLYADASTVPLVSTDKFMTFCFVMPQLLMFDGSTSACAWGSDPRAPEAGLHSPTDAPFMFRTDYVGNSNDSYWLSNSRQLLTGPAPFGYSPLYGPVGVEQMLRTRIGFKQLEEKITQRSKLQLSDLQDLAFANRIHAAELVLPELLPRCLASDDQFVVAGCQVLSAWDRRANLDSRGAVLFREFWNIASDIPGKWQIPLNPADPVNTPRGVAPSAVQAMLAALRTAVDKLQSLNIPLDGKLGDYQSDTRNGVRVPVHGGIGDIDGSYNSIHMGTPLLADGYRNIVWGTSYVQTVTFDDAGPVAHAMLVYGQSVDPRSPHYADQVPVYAAKQWPLLPFTAARIQADPAYKMTVLSE